MLNPAAHTNSILLEGTHPEGAMQRRPETKERTNAAKVAVCPGQALFARVCSAFPQGIPFAFAEGCPCGFPLFALCAAHNERMDQTMLTPDILTSLQTPPAPYETGAEFWNDPWIARQLLQTHLDPSNDLASYKPETMTAICAYLPKAMGLASGAAMIDLGCGPGLYCAALSAAGYRMTGVDRSENSLQYAALHAPAARFLRQSYLEPLGAEAFHAAIMISQDYGVLGPDARKTLLQNVRTALKPGGRFAFDVPSRRAYEARAAAPATRWYTSPSGLFRPHPHLVLEQTFAYTEHSALCAGYAVLDAECAQYRMWQTFFSPDTIQRELEANGFRVTHVLSDLTGTPYTDDSTVIGVICQKE